MLKKNGVGTTPRPTNKSVFLFLRPTIAPLASRENRPSSCPCSSHEREDHVRLRNPTFIHRKYTNIGLIYSLVDFIDLLHSSYDQGHAFAMMSMLALSFLCVIQFGVNN